MSSNEQGMRINQRTFTILQFFFLALAIVSATIKISLRLKLTKKLSADDVILIFAVILLSADVALFYRSLDLVYSIFSTDAVFDPHKMLRFSQLMDACAVISWTTIFSVKLSFIWFFRGLVDRLPRMKLYWTIVFCTVLACAPVCMFMTFYICSNFTLDLSVCADGIDERQSVYIYLTAALDIFTDLLIMSVPVALLWKVKINLRRKIALAAVLCLSTFMVIIAIVRIAFVQVPMAPLGAGPPKVGGAPDPHSTGPTARGAPSTGGPDAESHGAPPSSKQIDQSWMFFWLNTEASVAIIMVALTAFKSMLGRRAETNKKGYTPYGTPGSGSRPRAPIGKPNPSDDGKNEIVTADVYDMSDFAEDGKASRGGMGGQQDGRDDRSWYRENERDGRPF